MTSTSTFKNYDIDFDLDVEFEMTTADGRKMRSTFTLDDDGKLVQVRVFLLTKRIGLFEIQHERKIKESDKESTVTRYVDGNQLIVHLESGDVRARRVYERLAQILPMVISSQLDGRIDE